MRDTPTIDQWKQLYLYAEKIKKIAPWEWMYESDIFGISLPEYKDNFYISVLGNAGEHIAFCILQGDLSLGVFNYLSTNDFPMPGLFFYMKQLQISFEDRKFCKKNDLEIIKKLGLKFRGHNDYPTFRAMHAGYLPDLIDKREAQILLDVLEQSLEIVNRFQDDEDLLYREEEKVFFRVKKKTGGWEDEYRSVPNPVNEGVNVRISPDIIEKIMNVPRREAVVEMEIYPAPVVVNDEEGSPYVPLAVLIADQQSGGILKIELLSPAIDFIDFMETLPGKIMKVLQTMGTIPTTFQMTYSYLSSIFQFVFERLSLKLEIVDRLPNIEMIKRSMESHFQSRR